MSEEPAPKRSPLVNSNAPQTSLRVSLAKIAYFLPLFVLACLVSFYSISTVARHSFAEDCRNSESPYKFYDFCVYFSGGQIANSPDRATLYDAAVQQRYLFALRGTAPLDNKTMVMKCAPFFPSLLTPLTLLPIDTAFAIYVVGSVAAYFCGFFLLTRLHPVSPNIFPSLLVAFALLGTVPSFITATLGQISYYLFFFDAAYLYCLYYHKDKMAGILLALTSIKPHYTVFWVIPALVQKRWTIIIAATITELILLAMSVHTLGWSTVLHYPAAILDSDYSGSWAERAILMISLRGLLISLGSASLAAVIMPVTLAVMFLALGLLFYMWRGSSQTSGREESENLRVYRWLWASTVILCLFCSVHVYVYDAVLLIIPAILVFNPASFNPAKLSGNSTSADCTVATKYDRRIHWLLLATPYIQWIGMIVLPTNYHRSLPTSLMLCALTITVLLRLRQKPISAAASVIAD